MWELLLTAALSLVFFTALFLPAGWLLNDLLRLDLPREYRPIAAVLTSCMFYAALTALLFVLPVPSAACDWILRAVAITALSLSFGRIPLFRAPEARRFGAVFALAFLFAAGTSAYPAVRVENVQPYSVQGLSHLAIDNLIPYNVSRVFVEDLPPLGYQIVPGWRMSDRGPLAGLLTATVFRILGLVERAPWLAASPGLFFLYECLLVFFNLLALSAVASVASRFFGQRSALLSALFLSTSYFFWLNVVFTWPKFFAASFFLIGLAVIQDAVCRGSRPRLLAYSGICMAASMLAHDSVVFALAALALCLAGVFAFRMLRSPLRTLPWAGYAALAAGCACAYAPWVISKRLMGAPENRLLAHHMLCLPELEPQPLLVALPNYLSTHGLLDVIATRLGNIWYPFDLFHAWGGYAANWNHPYALLFSISHLAFYQLLHAFGFPALVLVTYAACRSRTGFFKLRFASAACFGSLVVAGMILGCPLATVNHAWAYPLFLFLAILAGRAASVGGSGTALLFGFSLGTNVLLGVMSWYYGEARFGALHAEPVYSMYQTVMFILLAVTLANAIVRVKDDPA